MPPHISPWKAPFQTVLIQIKRAVKNKDVRALAKYAEARTTLERIAGGRAAYAFRYANYRTVIQGGLFSGDRAALTRAAVGDLFNQNSQFDQWVRDILSQNLSDEENGITSNNMGYHQYAIEFVTEAGPPGAPAVLKRLSLIVFDPAIKNSGETSVMANRRIPPELPHREILLWRRGNLSEHGHFHAGY